MKTKITHIKGDTKKLTITMKDNEQNAIDLTGATIRLTVKEDVDSAEPLFQKVVTEHTNPTGGITAIKVVPADTESATPCPYRFDIQLTDALGDVTTFVSGTWTITEEITS